MGVKMRPFLIQFMIIFISKLGMLYMFTNVELYYFMIRTDWTHCGFMIKTWTWGRSARMKGLVSNSSSMVDGIVGSPDCLCCWAHDNFCDILALSGSTVWANCRFFTVYWESNKYDNMVKRKKVEESTLEMDIILVSYKHLETGQIGTIFKGLCRSD